MLDQWVPHYLQCTSECQYRRGHDKVQRKTSFSPAKPTKYGIKVWMQSDPTNGYTNEFQIYTGKVEGRREVSLAERVDCNLSRRIWNRCHIINVDKFFTCYDLLHSCYRMGLITEGRYEQIARSFPSSICQNMLWKSRDSSGWLSVESLPLLFGGKETHIYIVHSWESSHYWDENVHERPQWGNQASAMPNCHHRVQHSVHKWHLIRYWVWNKTFCWWLCLLSWN